MRWWRVRQMGVAGLGLFALLLQLFLSFGHVHVHEVMALAAVAGESAQARAAAVKSTTPVREQIPNRLPEDDCPICAAMHLTASGLLPAPPSFAAAVGFSHVSHRILIESFDFWTIRHLLFQTRAPPFA
jgi:hypothetical protein